jgi:hypothetical protein
LHKLLGNKRFVTILLYSGSIHGWNAIDFHSRCDDKGPTISLFKVKDGDCIGGYTKAKWISDQRIIADDDAMLFNLSSCVHLPIVSAKMALFCRKEWGPNYGLNELGALNEPFNGNFNCSSTSYKQCYRIQTEDHKNMLTNTDVGKFTITELEVWEVREIEQ